MALNDVVLNENNRSNFVGDCVKLIEEKVASTSGLSGLALKASYSVVKSVGPDYCAQVVDQLSPEILIALDRMWTEGVRNGKPVEYLDQRKAEVADELFKITDKRAKYSRRLNIRGTYEKIRTAAKNHVEKAVPDLAKIINKYNSAG